MKMIRLRLGILFLCFFLHYNSVFSLDTLNQFKWTELTTIPPAPRNHSQAGVAGAFAGIQQDVMLIAGGANFPDAPPWEGGQKVWHKQIYVLEKVGNNNFQWKISENWQLPQPLAYGVSISTQEGLVCIGGNEGSRFSDKVFLLKWDAPTQSISIENWPSLPLPLANMAGALVEDKIYIAGGNNQDGVDTYFFSLDISSPASLKQGWQSLPPWPGPQRTHATAVSQHNGEIDQFYLFGGRYAREDSTSVILHDAYAYNPKLNSWKVLQDISDGDGNLLNLAAGTSLPSGSSHILLFGGDHGDLFNRFEKIALDISRYTQLGDLDEVNRLNALRDSLQMNHPGFSREILAYHTITDTWSRIDKLPQGSQVTTTALKWGKDIIIPTGERSPGVRTPSISKGTLATSTDFGLLNSSVLGIYLLALVFMGIMLSKNQHSTEDFFKGGGRVPWWAAGLSIFGTQLSAITFMAIPAKTFATDWLYFFLLMSVFLAAPVVIKYFLPFYRRLNITTAYEYLEKRFNLSARILGSLMFAALQLGRLGIVLLLPSLALSVVTGIDVNVCILTMGILSIVYTVLGGIEAVIWTDVIQVIVLVGGALIVLVMIPFQIEGGLDGMLQVIIDHDKARIFDFSFDFTNATLWVVLIGGFFSNLIQYGSDQTVIQRFLTTSDEKGARQSIITGTVMVLPSALIFLSIGTALFVFYQYHPAEMSVSMDSTDAIFPWYMITQLPQGVSGLLIAAVFAAAMSSLDSSMNSVATVATTDFYRRFSAQHSEKHYLGFARIITIIVGLLGTLLALYMANSAISSLWDEFNKIVGLFAGGLGGLFVLGIFSKRANGPGAVIGLICSGIIQYGISEFTPLHFLMYTCTGVVSAIVIGYLASRLFPNHNKNISGLTLYSLSTLSTAEHKKAVYSHSA